MEMREIEIFLTLAEELHFGHTAQRLGVTTARVSQTIKKLERRFGAALFDRSSRKVVLTAIGRNLYGDLQPAFDQVQRGVRKATESGREVKGSIRVGFFGGSAGRVILEIAKAFQTRHPDCEVRLRQNQFADGFTRLLNIGEIDILVGSLPMREPGLRRGPVLIRETRVVAVSALHAFASRPSVLFADLARDTVLQTPRSIPEYWDAALAPTHTADGRPVKRGPSFATVDEMFALVAGGNGIYPLPVSTTRFYTRPDVTYVPIEDAPPFEWCMFWPIAGETERIREFTRIASAVTRDGDFGRDQ